MVCSVKAYSAAQSGGGITYVCMLHRTVAALSDVLYKRLRNTLTCLLTYYTLRHSELMLVSCRFRHCTSQLQCGKGKGTV